MIGKRLLKLCQPGVLIGAALLGLAAMGGGNARGASCGASGQRRVAGRG